MTRIMPASDAAPVQPYRTGDPAIAFLVDFDGTIAQTDVADTVMAEFVTGEWEAEGARYDAGLIGSRHLMQLEIDMLRATPEGLQATAAAQPIDPGFKPFVERARGAGIPVEVVSDGFGFYIAPAMRRLRLGDLPISTAVTTFEGDRPRIDFPSGHPSCFVCGTCKRNRVLAHQAAGRAVVFIGDGESDRYAAGYSDVVFAKRALVTICVDNGWPFRRWTEFAEIDAWLADLLERWRADERVIAPPRQRPFFCGPEIWGEGLWDPPPVSAGDGERGSRGDLDEGLAPG